MKRKPKLTELLWGFCATAGGLVPLATRIGVSEDTLRRRLKDPDTFTIREIKLIARKTGIPLEELLTAVKG